MTRVNQPTSFVSGWRFKFDKSAGPGDSSFGDEVGQDAAPLTAASDMLELICDYGRRCEI